LNRNSERIFRSLLQGNLQYKRRRPAMKKESNVFYWLPCSVVFVSTAHADNKDIMTATAMFVSEKEPLLVISVATGHLTEKLISRSGKFTLVIAADDQKQLAMQVGSFKGDAAGKPANRRWSGIRINSLS